MLKTSTDYFVNQACPVCGVQSKKALFGINHKKCTVLKLLEYEGKEPHTVVITCNNCRHYFMTPVIRKELMDKYYSLINSEFYHNRNAEPCNLNVKEYQSYAEKIKSKIKNGKILEIGCGNGYLLQTLKENGFDCYGVEPSPMAYNHAKNILNLHVENGFFDNSSFFNQKFDVIIMVDVVEHISDMQKFIQQITTVLKPGGYIFIATGNIRSFTAKFAGSNWGYFISWEHLSFFNPQSIEYLLKKNSFDKIEIEKTSLQHKSAQNLNEFFKNIIKKILNVFVKNKFTHGLCYDHMVVMAQYKDGK